MNTFAQGSGFASNIKDKMNQFMQREDVQKRITQVYNGLPKPSIAAAALIGLLMYGLYLIFTVNTVHTGHIHGVLIGALLVVGVCIMLVPSLSEMKGLLLHIRSVSYIILYTIFAVILYATMPKDKLDKYGYLINLVMLCIGGFAFYKGFTATDGSINYAYDKIKSILIIVCMIALIATFYAIDPGHMASKYFGYSLVLTMVIAIFAFLYLFVMLGSQNTQSTLGTTALLTSGSLTGFGFLAFLAIITAVFVTHRETLLSHPDKYAGAVILTILISVIWVSMMGQSLWSGVPISANSQLNVMKKAMLTLFGLVLSGLVIYWVVYNLEGLKGTPQSITSFILNIALISVIFALVYKTIGARFPAGNANKNAFFSLILNLIFYIPCLIGDGFQAFGKTMVGEYKSAEAGSWMMLLTAIVLFIIYFKMPSVYNLVSAQGGESLVNAPVYLNSQYNLGNSLSLNKEESFEPNYQYAISAWFYIDSAAPNMNPKYRHYTSLLNYGEKPKISYNGSKNTLQIAVRLNTNDLNEEPVVVYENDKWLLQKWNNVIVNYNGGTMDVFLNGELVKSVSNIVPYQAVDSLTIGSNDGIKGGVCNVVYYKKTLTSSNIYYIYNSVKHKSPPILDPENNVLLKPNIRGAVHNVFDY